MLGKRSPQGKLFGSDHLYLEHVGRGSLYGLLAREGSRLFPDARFAELYRHGWGRPSVPPSQLCILLVLQAHEGVSDEAAIERTAYDLRWKVALGLEVEQKLCAKSTLQLFRAKLVLHERYEQLFQESIEACRKAGLLRRAKLEAAIDTTPVLGRGAVKDTFNLVSDQIRRVLGQACALKGWEQQTVVDEHGLGRHFGASLKGSVELDWSDREARRCLIAQLVADAQVALELAKRALRGFGSNAERTRKLREARDLLADLLEQDVEEHPDDGQGPDIRHGTRRDRIVSTTDPGMRHGHKSQSKGFEGYKAAIVAETRHGVILATEVRAGNVHDQDGAAQLLEQAQRRVDKPLARVLGDTAYGSLRTRQEIEALGAELIAKAPPIPTRRGCFSLEAFRIDARRGVARCPAGKRSIRTQHVAGPDAGLRYVFSRKDCTPCPLRAKCTTARTTAKILTVTETTERLNKFRRKQRTKGFKRTYRRRVVVEHRIGRLVQLGARQARYLGKAKTGFQIMMLATVANLTLALPHASLARLLHALRSLIQASGRVWAALTTTSPQYAGSATARCFELADVLPPYKTAASRPRF